MRKSVKRTAVAVLSAAMAAGMFAGCGEAKVEKLDGTKTVATVNGTEIPMGILSMTARQQQVQMEAMYLSFTGTTANIWDTSAHEGSEETYGEHLVHDSMSQVELMYIMKEKAADYGVELTEEDQKAIAEAAKGFMAANDEETIETLAVTEDQVKTYLELQTYRQLVYKALLDEAEVNVTDEEANQSAFTYVAVLTNGEEQKEEDLKKKKEQAQEILDKVKEDPKADMGEIAKKVDESCNALTGTFTTAPKEGESVSYPAEVIAVLRDMEEGQVAQELIETETGYYIVRLDKALDEEATKSKRESLESQQRSEHYTETTDKWLEEADIKEEDAVIDTLKITDSHKFTMKAPAPAEETVDEAPAEK